MAGVGSEGVHSFVTELQKGDTTDALLAEMKLTADFNI